MKIGSEILDELIKSAICARNMAYAPYSNFRVGAAVLGTSGKLYPGSNVENASYGLSICAERAAIFKAISEGEREIRAIAVCADEKTFAYPCGACLQVMAEFQPKDMQMLVVLCTPSGKYHMHQLSELMPNPFRLHQ
ncbi:MAG: cytidine deaminase [Armatimonadota bacterium]